jgi:hypothetical protein
MISASHSQSRHKIIVRDFIKSGNLCATRVEQSYDVIVSGHAFILFATIFFQEFSLLSDLEKDWIYYTIERVLKLERNLMLRLILIEFFNLSAGVFTRIDCTNSCDIEVF